jgi:GxxExxY protein
MFDRKEAEKQRICKGINSRCSMHQKAKSLSEPDERINKLSHDVIGAAIEVHRCLGPGYMESIYEQALCVEFDLRGISYERQKVVYVDYKGHRIGESRLDIIVAGALVVELKSVSELAPVHTAQVISYLKATSNKLGLLINFNVPVLKDGIKRVVNPYIS